MQWHGGGKPYLCKQQQLLYYCSMKHSTRLQIVWFLFVAIVAATWSAHAFVIHQQPHTTTTSTTAQHEVILGRRRRRHHHRLFDAASASAAEDESINNNNSLEQSREEIDDYRRSTGISNLPNGSGSGGKKVREKDE